MFVYLRSEPSLWTVGFHTPEGKWEPESDHGSPEEAAKRCRFLNGGDEPRPSPITGEQLSWLQCLIRAYEAEHDWEADLDFVATQEMLAWSRGAVAALATCTPPKPEPVTVSAGNEEDIPF